MPDEIQAVADVSKRRKGVVTALVAIVLVAAVTAGAVYLMGMWPFGQTPSTGGPEQGSSREETSTAETTPTPRVSLPDSAAQAVLYWEQVASRQQIDDLVSDKFATFEISQVAMNDSGAQMRVRAAYREGGELQGTLLLRKYGESWFFSMITRDGNPPSTPVTGTADMAVAKAIAEGNAANQDMFQALLKGEFTTITVSKVTAGSGTAIVECMFGGGTSAPARGEITCIGKDVDGSRHWFITGFTRS